MAVHSAQIGSQKHIRDDARISLLFRPTSASPGCIVILIFLVVFEQIQNSFFPLKRCKIIFSQYYEEMG